MKRIKPSSTAHSSINPKLKYVLEGCDNLGVHLNFKLSDRLQERGLTTRKVAEMTGLRLATISDLCTGHKGSINLQHLLFLMIYLRITDIRDIIDIELPTDWTADYEKDRTAWIQEGEVPELIRMFAQCMQKECCAETCDKCEKRDTCGGCSLEDIFMFCKKKKGKL